MSETGFRIDRVEVQRRQGVLAVARSQLKEFFVGLDTIIDELCDAIAVWYTMPEILDRPVIVNLWGMTGVGKTDLIRRLVRHLDIQERFVEIELSNGDSTTWHSSVASRLTESGALQGEPTLLLFDEIQRFNTIDAEGNPLTNTKFADFWELLSDGRLSRRDPQDVRYVYAEVVAAQRAIEKRRANGDEIIDDTIGIWTAQSIHRTFGIADPIDELAELTHADAAERMRRALDSKLVHEPIDCSKCLVIVSGNLDEAFTMAAATSEADVDADIFWAFTSKITIVDIKNALIRRFKPEQVARFGNVHLVYSSLRRADFEAIIEREIQRIQAKTLEGFGIELHVDHSIAELIYRNGVFPVQGVRPVFSSVADILSTNLTKLVFQAMMDNADTITMRFDHEAKQIVAFVADDEMRLPYTGRIDRIRDDAVADKVVNVAVHEAGHALAYGLRFGLAPLQLTSRVASTYVGGFTFPHQIYETSQSLLDQVIVLLAGGIAEEIVFGREHASVGRRADRERATEFLIDFVRRYGFDREFQANYMLEMTYAMDRSVPEPDIEKLMTRLVAETTQLLSEHRVALLELGLRLADAGKLSSHEVAALLSEQSIDVAVRPEGHQWMPSYVEGLTSQRTENKLV